MSINYTNSIRSFLHSLGRENQQYIVPTTDGLKLLVLNLILLIIGLVYANNYVLLFNFILFCLFIGSMYYTHFNLQGLKLTSAKLSPVHVGESTILTLKFQSRSSLGHHFLALKFNSAHLNLLDQNFSFSLNTQSSVHQIELSLWGLKRGSGKFPRICIETLFPFHLFRSFVYFTPNLDYVVYPEKKALGLYSEVLDKEEKNNGEDDFHLKDFQLGDPLKNVHWKKLAQTNRWYSKKLVMPDTAPVILSFPPQGISERENELSSMSYALHRLYSLNIPFGIALNDISIPPDHSFSHLNRCLKALAEYET
jgi:uncharacterized protein (DUF58 family)